LESESSSDEDQEDMQAELDGATAGVSSLAAEAAAAAADDDDDDESLSCKC